MTLAIRFRLSQYGREDGYSPKDRHLVERQTVSTELPRPKYISFDITSLDEVNHALGIA